MTALEIIFAILLILSCVFIITVVLLQESKQGMSNVISGGSSDNYFQKNSGRTKEAKLSRATKVAAVVVFVIAIAVNLITVWWGGSETSAATAEPVVGIATDESLNTTAPETETPESAEDTTSDAAAE